MGEELPAGAQQGQRIGTGMRAEPLVLIGDEQFEIARIDVFGARRQTPAPRVRRVGAQEPPVPIHHRGGKRRSRPSGAGPRATIHHAPAPTAATAAAATAVPTTAAQNPAPDLGFNRRCSAPVGAAALCASMSNSRVRGIRRLSIGKLAGEVLGVERHGRNRGVKTPVELAAGFHSLCHLNLGILHMRQDGGCGRVHHVAGCHAPCGRTSKAIARQRGLQNAGSSETHQILDCRFGV